jgi:RNA polymerase-binding transcription factor
MMHMNTGGFRRLLEAKYRELSSTTSDRDDIVIEAAADEMDRLQQQMNRDIAIRNLDRTSTLLKSIQAALDLIQDEAYGVCLRCEQPIAPKRLRAVPWALHCVGCQETIDLHRVGREDPTDTIDFAA